jgi:effector-binding domain-containing protein
MSMDAMVGPMYERGLAKLGALAEKQHAETPKAPVYNITAIERPAMLYVGRRAIVKWADLKAFYGRNFGEGMAAIAKAGVAPAAAPSGVFFAWNEQDQTADMIAAIPVAPGDKRKLKGLEVFEAPAGKALLIDHVGPYSGTGKAHEAMDAYMKTNNLTQDGVMVEEYITDPGQEPDSMKWHTNIIYMVK